VPLFRPASQPACAAANSKRAAWSSLSATCRLAYCAPALPACGGGGPDRLHHTATPKSSSIQVQSRRPFGPSPTMPWKATACYRKCSRRPCRDNRPPSSRPIASQGSPRAISKTPRNRSQSATQKSTNPRPRLAPQSSRCQGAGRSSALSRRNRASITHIPVAWLDRGRAAVSDGHRPSPTSYPPAEHRREIGRNRPPPAHSPVMTAPTCVGPHSASRSTPETIFCRPSSWPQGRPARATSALAPRGDQKHALRRRSQSPGGWRGFPPHGASLSDFAALRTWFRVLRPLPFSIQRFDGANHDL